MHMKKRFVIIPYEKRLVPHRFLIIIMISGLLISGSLNLFGNHFDLSDNIQEESDTIPGHGMDESLILLNRQKNNKHITEAIGHIRGKEVRNLAGINRLNTLSGRVPGLLVMQTDGQPSWENALISIRGRNIFGDYYDRPVILIDGFLTADIDALNPYDIESITVLKDAASTALYGLRGGSGVILINTIKGRENKLQVNFNTQSTVMTPRFPELLGSDVYATLYNEALFNDLGPGNARYTEADIESYRLNVNPRWYPNNNYLDEFFNKSPIQTRNNLNFIGGDQSVQYYFSLGHVANNGLLNTVQEENTYNTNTQSDIINLYGNLVVRASDNLTVSGNIVGKMDNRTQPGPYEEGGVSPLINQMLSTPPNAYPLLIRDSLGGSTEYRNNFYGQLNRAGYSLQKQFYLSGGIQVKYDLNLIDGLSVIANGNYSSRGIQIINRSKSFAVYNLILDNEDNEILNKVGDDSPMSNSSSISPVNRIFNIEAGLAYVNETGPGTLSGSLLAESRVIETSTIGRIPHQILGLRGILDYNLRDKWLATLVMAYQGSAQYPEENRFGFFPAASLGYVLSNEDFLKDNSTINFLKLRLSAGLTGHEYDTYTSSLYFNYIERYQYLGAGAIFGTAAGFSGQRIIPLQAANSVVTFPKTMKYNIGLDANTLGNRLSLSMDYFMEKTTDILVGGSPAIIGYGFLVPEGIVENKGVEGILTWQDQAAGQFSYFLSVNSTLARNTIVAQNEEPREYPWMEQTGRPIGSRFGYVFDRFFTENDWTDGFLHNAIPDHSGLGTVIPGSLMYKDLNGDGFIDERDIQYIDLSGFPELWYGLSGGFAYRSFDFNFHFSGIGNRTIRYTGDYAYALNNRSGSVNEWHLERWQPGSGQNANYPSLSLTNFTSNTVTSTFWIENGAFLRLQSLEAGYTLPENLTRRVGIERFRIFFSGFNLYTWSSVRDFDPAGAMNATSYPIPPMYTIGANVSF